MIRVKLPFGGINPDQLDAFAAVVERYVPLRKGHITTRQNVQLHHVPLTDAATLIREISSTSSIRERSRRPRRGGGSTGPASPSSS